MTNAADAMVRDILLGPVNRIILLACLAEIVEQPCARLGRHVALQEKAQKEIDNFAVGSLAVASDQSGRVGSAAEAAVLGRGHGQGEILAEKQRLAVDPAWPTVPTL